MTRVGLATSADFPDLWVDDAPLVSALETLGAQAIPLIWDDASVDWTAYDVVVVRSTWDYHERRDAYLGWAASVPRLENPYDVLRWNTDKTYLRELATAGVPVVPTAWVSDGTPLSAVLDAHGWDDVVVKPSVSAGARNTLRANGSAGEDLLRRIVAGGGVAMVQPYLDAVEGYGERSLMYVRGAFTHAVRRNPALSTESDARYEARLVEPTAAELAVAEAALAAVGRTLLYARVDVVPDASGTPVLIELEVTEPHLFLRLAPPTSARRLAEAVVDSAGRGTTTGS